jgi:predicted amidohydrolase YtcJ
MRRRIAFLASVALLSAGCSGEEAIDSSVTSSVEPSIASVPADVATTSATATTTTTATKLEPASLILTGGTVLTMDRNRSVADAIALRGNQIVAVGSAEEIALYTGPDTTVVDLAGRALIPGFVDAHAHYYSAPDAIGEDLVSIQDYMLSIGVTSVTEMSVMPELLDELRRLDADGLIRVRSSLYLAHNTSCGEALDPWIQEVPPTRGWGERLRIGGVKVFTDGGACNVPASSYAKANGGTGDLYMTADEIANLVSSYEEGGYQVALHALGDRAIEATLDGLEMTIDDSGNPRRHRIEHNASVRPDMRARYDEVGAVALTFGSLPTCFLLGLDDRFQFTMPTEFQEWEWPWRDLLDENPNTVFAWHGDFPVFENSSPIANLAGYVTRRQLRDAGAACDPEPYHAKHAITVEEALEIMTIGSAYALDRETEVGSIEPGKLADVVVLSANPTAVAPNDLFDLTVELTVLDGEVVYCGPSMLQLCSGPPPGDTHAASSSLPSNPPEFAVDGSPDTHWGSGDFAPQWIEIALDVEMSLDGVRLIISQSPAGFTRHIVSGRLANGELVQIGEVDGFTSEGDIVEVFGDEPMSFVAIRVDTVESPSWVSWFEIEPIQAG